jgi:hypothetical protein
MKPFQSLRGLILLFMLMCGVTGCVTTYNHSSPEKLGKTVFKILKNQDGSGLEHVVATESDLESFLATSDMPEDELAAFKEEMKLIIAEFLGKARQSFQEASDVASREGVVMSKAKLGDIRFTTRQGPDNELAAIELDITIGERKFILYITDAGKVASGWVLGLDGFRLVAQ